MVQMNENLVKLVNETNKKKDKKKHKLFDILHPEICFISLIDTGSTIDETYSLCQSKSNDLVIHLLYQHDMAALFQ